MYRFLWRPRWIISHVAVLALVVAMVNLGLWQLSRLHERQAANRLIVENSTRSPEPVADFERRTEAGSLASEQYSVVEIRGTWDAAHEVAIRNRTNDGAPGRWVATPLRPADGGPAVLVVRGWIPQVVDDVDPPFNRIEPPGGDVRITGWVQPSQTKGWLGPTDRTGVTLHELARVDVARFAQQYDTAVAPFWVQLGTQTPPTRSALISPVPLPALDEGPHFSYAVQWAIFTLIALFGYPLVLYRVAVQRSLQERVNGDDDPADDDPADDDPADDDPADDDPADDDSPSPVGAPG